MSIKIIKRVELICDECGDAYFDENERSVWLSGDQAKEAASDDWKITKNNQYHRSCWNEMHKYKEIANVYLCKFETLLSRVTVVVYAQTPAQAVTRLKAALRRQDEPFRSITPGMMVLIEANITHEWYFDDTKIIVMKQDGEQNTEAVAKFIKHLAGDVG